MAKHMDDEVAYYYDSHPTEEDLMGETRVHSMLVHYLMEVLTQVQDLKSWRVGKTGPTPQVVFEIASEETWKKDLEEKPERYARMGVKEYFAYDPYERPLRRTRTSARRLFGWHLETERRVMRELPMGPDGRLWSFHLESWLVPDGKYLRLYDNQGNLRLTGMEAEARRAEALAEKLRSLGIDPDQV